MARVLKHKSFADYYEPSGSSPMEISKGFLALSSWKLIEKKEDLLEEFCNKRFKDNTGFHIVTISENERTITLYYTEEDSND